MGTDFWSRRLVCPKCGLFAAVSILMWPTLGYDIFSSGCCSICRLFIIPILNRGDLHIFRVFSLLSNQPDVYGIYSFESRFWIPTSWRLCQRGKFYRECDEILAPFDRRAQNPICEKCGTFWPNSKKAEEREVPLVALKGFWDGIKCMELRATMLNRPPSLEQFGGNQFPRSSKQFVGNQIPQVAPIRLWGNVQIPELPAPVLNEPPSSEQFGGNQIPLMAPTEFWGVQNPKLPIPRLKWKSSEEIERNKIHQVTRRGFWDVKNPKLPIPRLKRRNLKQVERKKRGKRPRL